MLVQVGQNILLLSMENFFLKLLFLILDIDLYQDTISKNSFCLLVNNM